MVIGLWGRDDSKKKLITNNLLEEIFVGFVTLACIKFKLFVMLFCHNEILCQYSLPYESYLYLDLSFRLVLFDLYFTAEL